MPDAATTTSRDDLLRAIAAHRAALVIELAAIERFLSSYEDGDNGSVTITPDSAPTTTYQDARAQRMMAVLQAPNNGHTRWMAPYINHGYLTRSKTGVYRLTPKGRDKLAQLQA